MTTTTQHIHFHKKKITELATTNIKVLYFEVVTTETEV